MDKDHTSPGFAQFGRLLWMGLGPGLLAITAMYIFVEGTGWNTPANYFYFFTVAVEDAG